MIFNGYTPSEILPFFAAAATFIAILYILRTRRRKLTVPSLGIWSQIASKAKLKHIEWIKRIVSFFICMAILAFLAVALLDPRYDDSANATRHAVIILDTSASMMAAMPQPSDCKTRFECARRDIWQLIDQTAPSDRIAIILADDMPHAIAGAFQADKTQLHKALRQCAPKPAKANINKALQLAKHLVHTKQSPEIYLFTDGQFSQDDEFKTILNENIPFMQKTYGAPEKNIAIQAFNARRYIANRLAFEVFIKIKNDFDIPVTVSLKLYNLNENETTLAPNRTHKLISQKYITLASGNSEMRIYQNLALNSHKIAAEIEITDPQNIADPLPLDNIAYAVVPGYTKPDILAVTPNNLYLQAALLLNENYRSVFITPNELPKNISGKQLAKNYDILIVDNSYNDIPDIDFSDFSGRAILINPNKRFSPYPQTPAENPVIERINSKHPVARWLSLKNLNVAHAEIFKNVKNDDIVLRAIEGPLIATKYENQQKFVAIGFSLVQSDLIFRVALPILFVNSIDWLINENAEPLRGFPANTAFHVQVGDAFNSASIVLPDNTIIENIQTYNGQLTFYGENVGFYDIRPKIQSARHPITVAANFFNEGESNLSSPQTIIQTSSPPPTLISTPDENSSKNFILKLLENLPESSQYIWVLALLAALAVIAVEWITYHRRYTV